MRTNEIKITLFGKQYLCRVDLLQFQCKREMFVLQHTDILNFWMLCMSLSENSNNKESEQPQVSMNYAI